jgi:hypothetical protein
MGKGHEVRKFLFAFIAIAVLGAGYVDLHSVGRNAGKPALDLIRKPRRIRSFLCLRNGVEPIDGGK